LISTSKVESVLEDPVIKGVALTGSDKAGSIVASIAGKNIKKCVMELGGSDPFIVLSGADVKEAARQAAKSRLKNTGQACNAAKRFIVVEDVADKFVEELVKEFESYKVGAPESRESVVGCLANESMYEDIKSQVDRSVEMGAKVVFQHDLSSFESGHYYSPVILDYVTEDMPVFNEETFGPVAPVIRVENASKAIQLANNSIYGLGASVWTDDMDFAKDVVALINAGNVFVNSLVKSDPRLPFGGVEKSGFGRELSSYGLKEFVNIKTVWIN
jgi:succinate-semialdehyde dehydrogenase/glutarate-semialdehyde dehydrogenase